VEKHTFIILAYRQSPFLEDCIKSIMAQRQQSKGRVFIATSTPSEWLSEIGVKYEIPIIVRQGTSNMADDWNFALASSDAELVTLVHQDDLYHEQYAEKIIQAANHYPDALIFFTNVALMINDKQVEKTLNLTIQRLLLWPYKIWPCISSRWIRRLTISFGNPICCPSVTYHRKNLGQFDFDATYPNNLDWEAWIRLARQKGSFVYERQILMTHRFHQDSETSASLGDQRRQSDDRRIFNLLWPKPIATLFANLYALAYRSKHG
jgi:hypothetical protein